MTTPTLLLQCMIGSCCIEERGDIVQIEEPATEPRGVVKIDDDISSSLSENRLRARGIYNLDQMRILNFLFKLYLGFSF